VNVLVAIILMGSAVGGQRVGIIPAANAAGPAQAIPWADRGWVDAGNLTYDNPKHRFHLVVPPTWLIDKSEQFDSTFLWSMKKFNAEGNQRAAFAIKVCPCQPKTAGQYYNDELAGFKQPSVASQYQLLSSGPTSAPGVYEMQFIITASKMRARLLYFLRNGTPYVVIFSWAADPTPTELAELDSVRRAMGLPEARAMSAPKRAPVVPSALGIRVLRFAVSTLDLRGWEIHRWQRTGDKIWILVGKRS
jgi:hypothetical protein